MANSNGEGKVPVDFKAVLSILGVVVVLGGWLWWVASVYADVQNQAEINNRQNHQIELVEDITDQNTDDIRDLKKDVDNISKTVGEINVKQEAFQSSTEASLENLEKLLYQQQTTQTLMLNSLDELKKRR